MTSRNSENQDKTVEASERSNETKHFFFVRICSVWFYHQGKIMLFMFFLFFFHMRIIAKLSNLVERHHGSIIGSHTKMLNH